MFIHTYIGNDILSKIPDMYVVCMYNVYSHYVMQIPISNVRTLKIVISLFFCRLSSNNKNLIWFAKNMNINFNYVFLVKWVLKMNYPTVDVVFFLLLHLKIFFLACSCSVYNRVYLIELVFSEHSKKNTV